MEKEELDGWLDRSPRNKLLFEELVRQEVASGKILAYGRGMGGGIEELLNRKKLRLAGRKRRIIRLGLCGRVVICLYGHLAVYWYFDGKCPGRGG